MEQGPMTTSRRSSLPAMMLWMLLRVWVISVSTGVPRIGKKRIRCSGGGNTVMSLMRSSSVWLVFSTLWYQASLAERAFAVMGCFLGEGLKKRAGKTKNRRALQRRRLGGKCSGACALASHPPGTENQNQK